MPSRILKESICTSDNIEQLSAFQETFFYRLMVNCDDYGRMDARPKILASRLFPLKDLRTSQIEDALRALTSAELVILYEVDGKPFLQMKTWDRHQQVRAKRSKYPSPDESECNQMQSNDIRRNQMQSVDSKCPRNPIQSVSLSESKKIDDDDDDDDDNYAREGEPEDLTEELERREAIGAAIEAQYGRKATPAEGSQISLRAKLLGQTPEMAALAIKIAAENGARNVIKYVTRIFDTWDFEHVKTPEEAEELARMRSEATGGLYALDSHEDAERMREARERRKAEHKEG